MDAGLISAILVALAAGPLSFLNLCALPIVPPCLADMSGVGVTEIERRDRAAGRKPLKAGGSFVRGPSMVFQFLGFTAFSWWLPETFPALAAPG